MTTNTATIDQTATDTASAATGNTPATRATTIECRVLRAMVKCCASEMTRFAMMGLCVDCTTIVATDGKVLATLDWPTPGAPEHKPNGGFSSSAPIFDVRDALKAFKPTDRVTLRVMDCGKLEMVGYSRAKASASDTAPLTLSGTVKHVDPTPGLYPAWRQVLPDMAKYTGAAAIALDPRLLCDVLAVFSAANPERRMIVRTRGEDFPVVLESHPEPAGGKCKFSRGAAIDRAKGPTVRAIVMPVEMK